MLLEKYKEVMLHLYEMASENMMCLLEVCLIYAGKLSKSSKALHPNLFYWYFKGQVTA